MRKLVLLSALLFSVAPAVAEFKTGSGADVWPSNSFECGIVRLTPRDHDTDPIYKINILIRFTDDDNTKDVISLDVAHTSVVGKTYDRSEQYDRNRLNPLPNKLDIYWYGNWRKNSAVTMIGRLYVDAMTGRVIYTELQSRNGRSEVEMISICHNNLGG
jgi:hypothetical protein